MTKTALRALITVTAAGAVLLTASPALADGPSEPTCAPGEEFQGEFGCVAVQLPEERIGSYRCPDPAEVIISVDPDVCGPAEIIWGPQPEETPSAPAPAPQPAPQAPVAQQAPVGAQPSATAAPVRPAPQPASAPVLDAAPAGQAVSSLQALLDRIVALIREVFTW